MGNPKKRKEGKRERGKGQNSQQEPTWGQHGPGRGSVTNSLTVRAAAAILQKRDETGHFPKTLEWTSRVRRIGRLWRREYWCGLTRPGGLQTRGIMMLLQFPITLGRASAFRS
jgi:hypothetical protein